MQSQFDNYLLPAYPEGTEHGTIKCQLGLIVQLYHSPLPTSLQTLWHLANN